MRKKFFDHVVLSNSTKLLTRYTTVVGGGQRSPYSSCYGLCGDHVVTPDSDLHGHSLGVSETCLHQDLVPATINPSQQQSVRRLVCVNLVRSVAGLHPHEPRYLTHSICR